MALIPGLTDDLARECLIRLPFESLGFILPVSKAWNSEIRSLDFHRRRRLSGYTRPWFVLPQKSPHSSQNNATTTYSVTFIEPINGFWRELPPGPDLPFTPLIFCRAAVVGCKVVVFISGSIDDEAANIAVHVFDFLTFRWLNGAVMPGPGRLFFGVASDPDSGKVLIAGGYSEKTRGMRSALLYDVESDTWHAMGDMENGRFFCDLMFHGGRFHVVNGSDQSNEECLVAESLDPHTWQWGPVVKDEFVELDAQKLDFQSVMENGEGDVYRFSIGQQHVNVEVQRSGKWEALVELPVEFELRKKLLGVMTWRDKMMVVRAFADSTSCWGFILDLKSCKWTKMTLPEQLNIYSPIFGCGIDF